MEILPAIETNVITANKQKLSINEQVSVELKFNKHQFNNVNLLLINNLSDNVILGLDFLKANNAVIDFKTNQLQFRPKIIKMEITNTNLLEIKPNSSMLISVQ